MNKTKQTIKRAIYGQVKDFLQITDLESFQERFTAMQRQYAAEKIYIEIYRHGQTLDKEHFERFATFFRQEGLEVACGLTTDEPENNAGGFDTLCYTDPESHKILEQAVRYAAVLSDELLIDDFLFTNCRCKRCISQKGKSSWADFRVELMQNMLESIILPTVKTVNPNCQVVLKFPNWFHGYNNLGYSLKNSFKKDVQIYAGAETRDPVYTQQHLPKYLSYFTTRLLSLGPNGLNGAWVDAYETTGNWTYFAQQIEYALFAKAKEISLFSLSDLMTAQYKLALPIAGEVVSSAEDILSMLGTPSGIGAYLPEGGLGEDYIHGFIGACGIPLEPNLKWPKIEPTILLTESSSIDEHLIDRMHNSLMDGRDVVITSGLLKKIQSETFWNSFAHIEVLNQTIDSRRFAYSVDGGVTFAGVSESATKMRFPVIKFRNNDAWELLAALGESTSCPLFLKLEYGRANLYIWTTPDDPGHLPLLPSKVLNAIRKILAGNDAPIAFRGPGNIHLFTYDNDVVILSSQLPYLDSITLELRHGYTAIEDLETGEIIVSTTVNGQDELRLSLRPGVSRIFKLQNGSYTR